MTAGTARTRWSTAAIAAAITFLAIAAYAPALRGQWLWDDQLEVASNQLVHAPGGWWRCWVTPEGMDYFPVKGMAQWAEWHAWGASTLGFHLANVLVHVLAALLAWRLFSRLGIVSGWLGAALFALHPMAVESVAWIAELKTELSMVFLILALTAYLDSEETLRPQDYWLSLAWFALALLSKSTVVMLPAVLLLWTVWSRGAIGGRDLRRLAPFFALSLAAGLVTIRFQGSRAIGLGGPMPALPERIGQAGWSLLAYAAKAVVPAGLSPIYGPIGMSLPPWLPWTLFAGVVAALWGLGGGWRRHGLFVVGVSALLLLPVLGLVPMSYLRVAPRADHLGYPILLPLVGLVAALAGAAYRSGATATRVASVFLAGCLLAGFLGLSRAHAALFQSPLTLWGAAAADEPDSWLAQANLGKALLDSGDYRGAATALDRAEALKGDSAEVRLDRGNAYRNLGQPLVAESEYREAVRLDPSLAGAYYDLGNLLLAQGDAAGAVQALRAALRRDPGYTTAHNELGLALNRLGAAASARGEFEAAIALEPGNREAHLNLGNWYARAGQPGPAIAQYKAALSIDPSYGPARANLEAVERAYGLAGKEVP